MRRENKKKKEGQSSPPLAFVRWILSLVRFRNRYRASSLVEGERHRLLR